EFSVPLARTGGVTVRSSVEDVTLVFGGPRVGKSGWLAGRIIDAPGAVLATSTRTDLLTLTGPIRERSRGPVLVFNPTGLGGGEFKSTIRFNPLVGCEDAATAILRAIDMVPRVDDLDGERAFWQDLGRSTFAALLHAAALGERSARVLLEWVARPDDAKRDLTQLLRRSPEPAFAEVAAQWLGMPDRTRASVSTALLPSLSWLQMPGVMESVEGPARHLDVREVLDERATVHLIGQDE